MPKRIRQPAMQAAVMMTAILISLPGIPGDLADLPGVLSPVVLRAERPRIVETIALPAPLREGGMSLEETLSGRHSMRRYARGRTLALDQIGQLLWAAQGLNRPGKRTAPSAGALYALETYVVTRKGVYHYRPQAHEVLVVWQAGLLDSLWAAAGGNKESLHRAPAVFVIAGVVDRMRARYGQRALRYVTLEAGHAAQNLLLQAVALGLGGVPIGAYSDEAVQEALDLPAEQTPFYLIPVGYPP